MSCILWKGAVNSGGYPVTWYQGKVVYAHRRAVNAEEGVVVRHICDNPLCVNPDHLIKGTSAENSADMVAKGRQAKGEDCGNSKLTEEEVIAIRCSHLTSRQLAKLFNISKTNVLDIKKRKTWRHL